MNIFKRKFFNYLLLGVSIFSFFSSANADNTPDFSQEVYLADEPLPKLASKLKKQGMSEQEIIKHLKNTLPKLTPELAQNKFGIVWIDNSNLKDLLKSLGQKPVDLKTMEYANSHYPTVAVCYMDKEVGFGLFALEDIKPHGLIAEHTGKHRENGVSVELNSYTISAYNNDQFSAEMVDAKQQGNAARFAQNLLSKDELAMYEYEVFGTHMPISDVAVANSKLVVTGSTADWHMVLCATTNIKAFEQIGFFYGPEYGYEKSNWPEEPHLFSKENGDTISQNKYQILSKGVMLADPNTKQYAFIPPVRQDILEQIHEYSTLIDGYMYLPLSGNEAFIVELNHWKEQIATSLKRVTISGYLIKGDLDAVRRFVGDLTASMRKLKNL